MKILLLLAIFSVLFAHNASAQVETSFSVTEVTTVSTDDGRASVSMEQNIKEESSVSFSVGSDSTEDSTEPEGTSIGSSEEPEEAAAGYLKIGDIKGESTDSAQGSDGAVGGEYEDIGIADSEEAERGIEHDDIGIVDSTDTGEAGVRMNKADLIEHIATSHDSTGEDTAAAKKPKEIVVVGSKISESQEVQEFLADENAVPAARAVDNEDDLTIFAAQVINESGFVEEIRLGEERIELEYDQPGRILGLIPVSIPQEVSVSYDAEAEGRVRVAMPWWHIFASKSLATKEVTEDVDSVMDELQGIVVLADRAVFLENLVQKIKTRHDTAMNSIRNIRG